MNAIKKEEKKIFKPIRLNLENWKIISNIKTDNNLGSMDEAFSFLLDNGAKIIKRNGN